MNIGFIIQARLGSTRLPGKILLPFSENKSIIEILLSKLNSISSNAKIIVATSNDTSNDKLVDAIKNQAVIYRGSENDVLNRFICAAENNSIDRIIRICSDNPFIDIDGLKQILDVAKTTDADYVGFQINGKPSIQTHFGFWAEYVTLNSLKRVAQITNDSLWHEHVTNYIYFHPEKGFKIKWLSTPTFINGRNDIRLTIDTKEDFKSAKAIYHALKRESGYP